MKHVVGAKKTERQGLDVAFLLDLEMYIPKVGDKVVNIYQPGQRHKRKSAFIHRVVDHKETID